MILQLFRLLFMNFGMKFISQDHDSKNRLSIYTLVLEKQLHGKLAVKIEATSVRCDRG